MGRSNSTTAAIGDKMSVVGGKFTLRVPEGTPGAVARELTKGDHKGSVVYELGWPSLEGVHLIGGQIVKPEGLQFAQAEITFKDFRTNETSIVCLPTDSRYLHTFIQVLPSINPDMAMNVELHLSKKKSSTGGATYNLRIYQNGESLKSSYIEWKKDGKGENVVHCMNGCPEAEFDEVEKKWDFSRQKKFFMAKFKEFFDEYVPPYIEVEQAANIAEDEEIPDEPEIGGDVDDDIPF